MDDGELLEELMTKQQRFYAKDKGDIHAIYVPKIG